MKCAGHILRESFKSGFRPCHSVFIGVGDIFRSGFFMCDHFEFKYWRGRRGRSSRPDDRPQVSCEHTILLEDTTLAPRIYFLLYTKVGLFISFSGCLGLLAGVCRFWRVSGGVGGPLTVPTWFGCRAGAGGRVCHCVCVCVCHCVCECVCVNVCSDISFSEVLGLFDAVKGCLGCWRALVTPHVL